MPITFGIRADGIKSSGGGPDARVDVTYTGSGSSDYDSMVTAFLATAPPTWGSLLNRTYEVNATENDELWECVAHYSSNPAMTVTAPTVGGSTYSFSTGGGSVKMMRALPGGHLGDYGKTWPGVPWAYPPIPMQSGGAINVNSDGEAEGVDVDIADPKWDETHYLNPLILTNAYKDILETLTGMMNVAPFRGRARGEVLFLGADGSDKGTSLAEVTFHFARQRNVTNLVLDDGSGLTIVVPEKLGWDYLWHEHEREVYTDGNGQKTWTVKLKGSHLERVRYFGDFSLLGIGTT